MRAAPAYASPDAIDTTLAGYAAKMVFSMLVLAALGFAALRLLPQRFRARAQGRLSLIGAMPLGRDAIYVVRIGPEVLAVLVHRAGSSVLGRWSADEWEALSDDNVS